MNFDVVFALKALIHRELMFKLFVSNAVYVKGVRLTCEGAWVLKRTGRMYEYKCKHVVGSVRCTFTFHWVGLFPCNVLASIGLKCDFQKYIYIFFFGGGLSY